MWDPCLRQSCVRSWRTRWPEAVCMLMRARKKGGVTAVYRQRGRPEGHWLGPYAYWQGRKGCRIKAVVRRGVELR